MIALVLSVTVSQAAHAGSGLFNPDYIYYMDSEDAGGAGGNNGEGSEAFQDVGPMPIASNSPRDEDLRMPIASKEIFCYQAERCYRP